ncbi:MAG: hypothetical protein WBA77_20050 [Microcoleaceae cyanobacterium]
MMIKPELRIDSFYQVITQQPQLFQGEAFQDLSHLEIALDRVEYEPDSEKLEFISDAIIDFCDSNPEIHQAVQQQLEQNPDQTVTEEIIPALTEAVNRLVEQAERATTIS